MVHYTLVCTSCDRMDLLRRTLDSYIECADSMPRYTIIVEDGPADKPAWLSEPHYRQLGDLKWLSNGVRMGQIYSIDRAYSEVTTDYLMHLEDDWLFKDQGFLQPSYDILVKHPEIIQVSLRGDTGWHPLIRDPKYPFKIAEPNWRGGWGGISFNPSLRRLSDYQKIGSYGRHVAYGTHGLGHEMQLSKMHLDMGYRIADLGVVHVEHIGNGRSRAIEPLPAMPRILIAVPACHKLEYGQYESSESPHYNNAHKPYGTDIHISGANPRIQALRDTWFKDVEPFKAHVDVKLFYGLPHGREPLPDEVFLDVKDDYVSLPFKTVAICKWALDNGYEYLLKVDDDTYVWVDRLVKEIMENRFIDYGGYEHSGVCTGGPGYILSKRAMKIVAESSPTHWAEDCHTGITLTNAGIKATMLPNHRPGFSAHYFDINKIPANTVTIHAVKPEDMKIVRDK